MRVEAAIALAVQAHFEQRDKGGAPMVLHPLRVMLAVAEHGETAMVVAALHDVVEDKGADAMALLRQSGLTREEETVLVALTHGPHEPYLAYIRRVAAVPLAKVVKLADIADNLNPARLAKLAHGDQVRLRRKYEGARAELVGLGPALAR